MTEGDGAVLIRIHLHDSYASSTTVKVTTDTTARDVCNAIASKLAVAESDRLYDTLICVVSGFDGKTNLHWLKTLKKDDRIIRFQTALLEKRTLEATNSDIVDSLAVSWYYKDIRSAPLCLDGETSGNSSSDDEEEIALNDLLYFGNGDRRAVMLKRSARDPNLWRRRLCVLTDKLWCINLKRRAPYASCIPLNGTVLLQEDAPELNYPYGIILHSTAGDTVFLRASSASEQHIWRDELQDRVEFGVENAVLYMAEVIICDEQQARGERRDKHLTECMHTHQMISAMKDICSTHGMFCDDLQKRNKKSAARDIDAEPLSKDCEVSPVVRRGRSDRLTSSRHTQRGRSDSPSLHLDARKMSLSSPTSLLEASSGMRVLSICAPLQLLHSLHMLHPRCASAVALLGAVHTYRATFRHDIHVPPRDMWEAALRVYLQFILPYLVCTSGDSGREFSLISSESPEFPAARERDLSQGLDSPSKHFMERKISRSTSIQSLPMDIVTRVHRELFANIRKKKKDERRLDVHRKQAGDSNYWFWPSASDIDNTKKVEQEEMESLIRARTVGGCYEIVDLNSRPSLGLFDDLVIAMYSILDEEKCK